MKKQKTKSIDFKKCFENKMTSEIEVKPNQVLKFAREMMRSTSALMDGNLHNDFQLLLNGHAFYINEFLCEQSDFELLEQLALDLKQNDSSSMIKWSKHQKYEDPTFSKTFTSIVERISVYFDLEVFATRLNFYADNSSWKPFHHDSHAYAAGHGGGAKEDFTVGLSLGATRALVFRHEKSQQQFSFPQANGDVFAFDSKVNQTFEHGVPREKTRVVGPRFSIICWGKRRTLNTRNAGADEIAFAAPQPHQQQQQQQQRPLRSSKDHGGATSTTSSSTTNEDDDKNNEKQQTTTTSENESTMTGNEVALLVNEYIQKQKQEQERRVAKEAKKTASNPPTAPTTTSSTSSASTTTPTAPKAYVKPKSRVQGGWNRK